jgi:dihydroorotate dehydrogenase
VSNKAEWKDRAVTMDFLLGMVGAGRLPTEVHLAEPPPPPRFDGFQLSNREITRRMVIQMHDTRQVQRKELKRKAEVDRAAFIDSLPDEDIRKRVAYKLAARAQADKKARIGDVADMMQHNDNLAQVLDVNFNKPDMSGLKEGTSGSGVLHAQLVRAQEEEADFDAEQHAMDLGLGRDTDADAY